MNIDWSKAPEDATHAGTTTRLQIPVFYKNVREDEYSYWYDDGDGWREDVTGNPACAPLIERPKKQEAWNGEGLPPVGTVCDMHIDDFGWITGTVVVHIDLDEPTAVAHNGKEVFHGNASAFRPIKTAEQLVEEERERTRKIGVAQMMEHIHFSLPKELWGECEPACYALYDAGFKIQKYSSEERGREIIKMAAIVAHLFKEEKEPEYPALEKILGELYDSGYKLAK